jgi:hypothetical protein
MLKKSSRRKTNYFVHFVCLALTWTLWADRSHPTPRVAGDTAAIYKITERRANYFVIQIKLSPKLSVPTKGFVYIDKRNINPANPAGTFTVIDREDNRLLCQQESIRPGIDGSQLKYAVPNFTALTKPPQPPKKNNVPPFRVNNIRFVHLTLQNIRPGKFFISAKPLAVKSVTPLSISGIKHLLFDIEKKSPPGFSANLIRLPQIRPLELSRYIDFNDKHKLYLGIADHKLCMIAEENGLLQSTALSDTTLNKFKNNLYFYVLLEKKGRVKGNE